MSEVARVPRNDLSAEACVLSAVMLSPDAVRVLSVLKPEEFYSPANRRAWEACQALAEVGTPIDIETVAQWLRGRNRLAEVGGLAYLATTIDAAPVVDNVDAYVATVRDAARQRAVVAFCQKVAAEGYGDVGNVTQWASGVEAGLYELATAGTAIRKTLAPMRDIVRDVFVPMAAGVSASGARAHSGIEALDAILACHEGDAVVIAGRPGMGKSAIAGGWALSVGTMADQDEAQASLVLSAEMPREQWAMRALCAEGQVELGALRRGALGPEQWARLTSAGQVLQDRAVFVDDKSAPSLGHVRAAIRSTKRTLSRDWKCDDGRETRLRFVVVDYIQIMGARHEKGRNREQEVAELMRGLKEIAREEKVVLAVLSQLNRGVEMRANKRPTLADLRESGAIEQDADSIVFVYRDERYNPKTKAKGRAELIVAKQRNGGEGRAIVAFDGAYTLFRELTDSERRQLESEGEDDGETQHPADKRWAPRSGK